MVKGFHATLPVACERLRASRGCTFPTGPTHTGLPSMQIPTGELGYIPASPDCQSGSKAPFFQGETGGAPRVTRAPCALKPPSYPTPPTPPAPSTARARAVIACDSSALAVMPYTAGPHELCPTPAAPQPRSRSTISPVGPGANTPPWAGAN